MGITWPIALIAGFSACSYGATYYVSTAGNDFNPGTPDAPFRPLSKGAIGGNAAGRHRSRYGRELTTMRAWSLRVTSSTLLYSGFTVPITFSWRKTAAT